jgi:uncharacterized protein
MKAITTMEPATSQARAPGLLLYLIAAFAISWSLLGLAVLAGHGLITLPLPAAGLITLATLGPFLAALGTTALETGRRGVRALLAQVTRWRVRSLWYAVALIGPALVMLTAFLLWLALGGPLLPVPPLATWLAVPILTAVLFVPALFEEVGWRGFVLPRLQSRYGALSASLLIGVAWAFWHIPLWFIPNAGFANLPFLVFIMFTTTASLLFTWLYNGTGGSLLIVGLAHGAINAYPLPWGTALSGLPENSQGFHIQIPVTVVLLALAVLLVLATKGLAAAEE